MCKARTKEGIRLAGATKMWQTANRRAERINKHYRDFGFKKSDRVSAYFEILDVGDNCPTFFKYVGKGEVPGL